MRHTRKTPLRTCTGCRTQSDKRDLVRIVRTKDGEVSVDPTGRNDGRGAYVCPRAECFETASRGRLAAALRARLHEDDIDRLRHEFEDALMTESTSTRGR